MIYVCNQDERVLRADSCALRVMSELKPMFGRIKSTKQVTNNPTATRYERNLGSTQIRLLACGQVQTDKRSWERDLGLEARFEAQRNKARIIA